MAELALHVGRALALLEQERGKGVAQVPYRLRYRMAFDHGLSRTVLGVFTRVLCDAYARGARARGIRGGRTGTVTVIQRAGGGLNVNPHFHTLVLDGVFRQAAGRLEFHRAPGPSDAEVAEILALVRNRIQRLLQRRGLAPEHGATEPVDRLGEESRCWPGSSARRSRGGAGRARGAAGAAAREEPTGRA